MVALYVQFSDSTETEITSIFSCPQNPSSFPNQAEIDSSDSRYKAYYEALSPIATANSGLPVPD